MAQDDIARADKSEAIQARLALRTTRNREELVAAWALNAEHFRGDERIRLQRIFSDKLRSFGALHG